MTKSKATLKTRMEWKPITGTRVLKSGHVFEGPEGGVFAMRALRDNVIPGGIIDGGTQLADDMEAHAQEHAPWTDRTGDARAGLEGTVEVDGDQVIVALQHTVPYGIWLENLRNGRYAVILPTLEVFSPIAARIIGGGVRAAIAGRGSKVRDIKSGRFAA